MKILSAFTLVVILVFIGCTSAKYQEMQNERDQATRQPMKMPSENTTRGNWKLP